MTVLDAGRFARDAHIHQRQNSEDYTSLVLEAVAAEYGCTTEALFADSRIPPLPLARQHAMFILHEVTGMSKIMLGGLFDRDRATVSYGIARMRERATTAYFAVVHEDILAAIAPMQAS